MATPVLQQPGGIALIAVGAGHHQHGGAWGWGSMAQEEGTTLDFRADLAQIAQSPSGVPSGSPGWCAVPAVPGTGNGDG